MSVLVVFAHPLRESFCGAIFDRVVGVLEARNLQHATLDLHGDGFEPAAPLPTAHSEALKAARTLVFVYPTWWSTQPAMLSAWLTAALRGELAHVEHIICFVTHGGSRWSNWLSGKAGRRFLARRVRQRCAAGASFTWVGCYGLDRGRAADRAGYLDHAERMAYRLLSRRDRTREHTR